MKREGDAAGGAREQDAGSGKHEARDVLGEQRATPGDCERDPEPCDICGVPALVWRKCKLVCENCGAINKTCADL